MSTAKPRPKRAEKKVEERIEISEELLLRTTIDIEDLVRHVKSEVEKGNVRYYTPYTLAQSLGIKVSDARKVLREAVKLGLLKLYSGGRRSPTYVPVTPPRSLQEKTK
ncbi:MAG: 30S ribosomal protein S25e [Desulfurococcaceae archaeon]